MIQHQLEMMKNVTFLTDSSPLQCIYILSSILSTFNNKYNFYLLGNTG